MVKADLIHIRARQTKHGARRWGPHELAQAAAGLLRQRGELPPDITGAELVKRVRRELRKNRAYRRRYVEKNKKMPRNVILDAAATQGIAWRRRWRTPQVCQIDNLAVPAL